MRLGYSDTLAVAELLKFIVDSGIVTSADIIEASALIAGRRAVRASISKTRLPDFAAFRHQTIDEATLARASDGGYEAVLEIGSIALDCQRCPSGL